MELSKIKAYIGFAIKSRSIKYGIDDIMNVKRIQFIMLSDRLAESSKNKIINFANKNNCEFIEFPANDFSELFNGNESIKAISIIDKGLSDAIKKIMNPK